jgi:hypothetical protein
VTSRSRRLLRVWPYALYAKAAHLELRAVEVARQKERARQVRALEVGKAVAWKVEEIADAEMRRTS